MLYIAVTTVRASKIINFRLKGINNVVGFNDLFFRTHGRDEQKAKRKQRVADTDHQKRFSQAYVAFIQKARECNNNDGFFGNVPECAGRFQYDASSDSSMVEP